MNFNVRVWHHISLKLSQQFIYSRKSHVRLGIHTRRYLFLELATAAEITNHTTTPRSDSLSTWQHNPALSSLAMTHISLSVSRRGGVQNDAPAWKILFEGTCGGLTEQPDWGEMSWYCHSAKSFFVSAVGCGTVGPYSFSLKIWKHPLLIGHSISPAVRGYEPINTEICPVCCCNSPGSCCPAESWWGCCWGWKTGRVLLWCGEPLRFLTGLRQFRKEGPVLLEWRLKLTEADTVAIALRTSGSFSGEIFTGVLTVRTGILTVQPCHTGVMYFELFTLQILHSEMGTE